MRMSTTEGKGVLYLGTEASHTGFSQKKKKQELKHLTQNTQLV